MSEFNSSLLEYIERSRSKVSDYKKIYTKEYVDELNSIHTKEKNQLLFKISSLETELERLKNSFNDHLSKLQYSLECNNKENNSLITNMESENNNKLKKIEEEKNNEINNKTKEIEKLSEEKTELDNKLNQIEKEYNIIKDTKAKETSELSNTLNNMKNEFETYKNESESKINGIISEYENKLKDISKQKEEEYISNNIQNKIAIDNLTNQINELNRQNYLLKTEFDETEKKYRNIISEMTNESDALKKELNYLQNQNSELYEKFRNLEKINIKIRSDNEYLLNTIDKQREDLNRKSQDAILLQNSINSLQNSNSILQDKNNKLNRDYTSLCTSAECMNLEYMTKLKSLNHIEDKNFMLERENNELRNKIGRFVRPYSFNK